MSSPDQARSQGLKEATAQLFDRAAPTYDQVGPRFFSYFGRRLVELVSPVSGSSVLDVAAGRGAILFPAADKVGPEGEVIGIDLSQVMVELTSAAIGECDLKNARILQMDAEQLDFPADSFDYVFCGFALFFLPQQTQILTEIKRVLKPGGLLAFSTWGQADERWKWANALFARPQTEASKSRPSFDSPADLEKVVKQVGFSNVRVVVEEADLPYTDAEDWWQTQWSHGMRAMWERMSPEVLEQTKAAAFQKLGAMQEQDGIHQIWQALFTLATKSEIKTEETNAS